MSMMLNSWPELKNPCAEQSWIWLSPMTFRGGMGTDDNRVLIVDRSGQHREVTGKKSLIAKILSMPWWKSYEPYETCKTCRDQGLGSLSHHRVSLLPTV